LELWQGWCAESFADSMMLRRRFRIGPADKESQNFCLANSRLTNDDRPIAVANPKIVNLARSN
jgi:hypothetical protein